MQLVVQQTMCNFTIVEIEERHEIPPTKNDGASEHEKIRHGHSSDIQYITFLMEIRIPLVEIYVVMIDDRFGRSDGDHSLLYFSHPRPDVDVERQDGRWTREASSSSPVRLWC